MAEKANTSAGQLPIDSSIILNNGTPNPIGDEVVMIRSFDHKNRTGGPSPSKLQTTERVTALWKGQSTLATLTKNPMNSHHFRASSTIDVKKNYAELNPDSEEQSLAGAQNLEAMSESTNYKYSMNQVGLDPRRAIFAPKPR